MQRLGIKASDISTQIVQRDRHAELVCLLAMIASSLENFATEIRELQRPEIGELSEAFEAIHKAGRFKIVFDMSGVEYISSAGLRVLINVQKTCKQWNRGEVALAGLSQHIEKTLHVAGLISLFRIFVDPAEAVGSF